MKLNPVTISIVFCYLISFAAHCQEDTLSFHYSPTDRTALNQKTATRDSVVSPYSARIEMQELLKKPTSTTSQDFVLRERSLYEPVVNLLFMFYKITYGDVKGPTCLFYPSCSGFGRAAIAENGFVKGLLMTSGRLIRAHVNQGGWYPVVVTPDGERWVDLPAHELVKTYTGQLLAPEGASLKGGSAPEGAR